MKVYLITDGGPLCSWESIWGISNDKEKSYKFKDTVNGMCKYGSVKVEEFDLNDIGYEGIDGLRLTKKNRKIIESVLNGEL